MDPLMQNLLYRKPEYYDAAVTYGAADVGPVMCDKFLERTLGREPRSVLDAGSGTGRDLAYFARQCDDCRGFDAQASMVEYANERWPGISFETGDLRSARLGRTFEVITCLGYVIANIHSADDLKRCFATFEAHAEPGTILILDAINALGAAVGNTLAPQFEVDAPDLRATAAVTYENDFRRQLIIRNRRWEIEGAESVDDFVRLRTLTPMELELYLSLSGFETIGIYDNRELRDSDMTGINLFAAARYIGS